MVQCFFFGNYKMCVESVKAESYEAVCYLVDVYNIIGRLSQNLVNATNDFYHSSQSSTRCVV